MNVSNFFDENEKPLDKLVTDGGFCGIFRNIGCIGDSLSSGEFESRTEDGIVNWHDMYEYSWGQYIARSTGSTVYNFSRGGMTARELAESFGEECKLWSTPCQAYIIALGVNDISGAIREKTDLGDINDLGTGWEVDNFARAYIGIITRLKRMQPHAKFFLMTVPKEENESEERMRLRDRHAEILYETAEKYANCYILDFRKYAPVYDSVFKEKFFLGGHLNPMGYILTARMTESYIDYIIRHNSDDFKQTAFIGTTLFHHGEKL